jgi:hypothetical protein
VSVFHLIIAGMASHRPVKHAGHEVMAVARAKTKTHYHLRRRLAIIFGSTAVFAIICTLVTYLAEHGAGGEIHSLWDSFLFSASQLLTGSSVANPKTNLGKVLELVFDLWAIFVVASLAGSFGAFFHARSKELNEEMEKAEHAVRRIEGGDEKGAAGAKPA